MTEISCFFKTRVKGSVTPLMYGRDAKDLRDSEVQQTFQQVPQGINLAMVEFFCSVNRG